MGVLERGKRVCLPEAATVLWAESLMQNRLNRNHEHGREERFNAQA